MTAPQYMSMWALELTASDDPPRREPDCLGS
jgi:hypothetical protein